MARADSRLRRARMLGRRAARATARDASFCAVLNLSPSRRGGRARAALRLFALALLVSPLSAQSESDEPSSSQLRALRATAPIRIDGVLDDSAWLGAEVVALAFETQPGENRPAAIATTCRILYDSERLYVGCSAEDPHPEEIRARFTDRDQAYDDDFVGVRLDPFLDRRRSFEFYVNPLGVQMDLFRDDLAAERQGGDDSEDISWDALWDSAGRITAGGFEVELAIPFSSLRFPPGSAAQTWGIGFSRVRPRRDRLELASEPFDRNRNCSVCQLSTISGFAGVTPGRHLELDPTLTIQRAERRAEVPDGPRRRRSRRRGGADRDLGRDARHHPVGHGESGLLAGRGRRPRARRQPAVRAIFSSRAPASKGRTSSPRPFRSSSRATSPTPIGGRR